MIGVYTGYQISEKISLLCSLGPQLNTNLWNKRLSYEDTGWPKKIDYSLTIYAAYKI